MSASRHIIPIPVEVFPLAPRPPVVVRGGAYALRVVVERHAAFPDRPLQFVQRTDRPVRHRFPHRRPEPLSRVQLRRVRGQEPERQSLRQRQPLARVPSRAIHDEDDPMCAIDADIMGERRECRLHRRNVHPRHGEPVRRARRRMDEGVDPQPLVARVDPRDRSLPARRPDPPQHRLQAQARLILRPRLHARHTRHRAQHGDMRVQALRKAACSSAVAAWTWRGRGTCGVRSRRRR